MIALEPEKVNINNYSLWLLLAEYAPITVIGIENPYQGWLVEDIEADAEKNIQLLKDQGLLLAFEDDHYELLPDLRVAVDLIAKPRSILIALDSSSGTMQEQTYYYLGEQESVRLSRKSNEVQLERIANRPILLDTLLNNLPLPLAPQPATAFTLSEEVLFQASSLAVQAKYPETLNLLDGTNLTDSARNELMQALENRQANASFAILDNPSDLNNQRVTGFGIVAGGDRLWTLTPNNKPGRTQIDFSPTTPEELRRSLSSLL